MTAFSIAIEGSDGSGKETQSTLLKEWFTANLRKVASVSFPRYGLTVGGRILAEVLKSEGVKEKYDFAHVNPYVASLLYAEDRLESLPYLQDLILQNNVVIFDRYVSSNLLHQGGKFSTEEERRNFMHWLHKKEFGENKLPSPDVTIYLNLPFEVSYKRSHVRATSLGYLPDAVETDMEYVRNGHSTGIFYAEELGWKVIDCVSADGRELTREEIHTLVLNALLGEHF